MSMGNCALCDVQDVQLPSYYKHLRDDTKPSEEGEELKEPATGYGAVYGPQNAPDASKGSNDHAANSQYAEAGTRLGLGAKGKYSQSLTASEQ